MVSEFKKSLIGLAAVLVLSALSFEAHAIGGLDDGLLRELLAATNEDMTLHQAGQQEQSEDRTNHIPRNDVEFLRTKFDLNPRPSAKEMDDMAQILGESYNQKKISNWFYRERTKPRKNPSSATATSPSATSTFVGVKRKAAEAAKINSSSSSSTSTNQKPRLNPEATTNQLTPEQRRAIVDAEAAKGKMPSREVIEKLAEQVDWLPKYVRSHIYRRLNSAKSSKAQNIASIMSDLEELDEVAAQVQVGSSSSDSADADADADVREEAIESAPEESKTAVAVSVDSTNQGTNPTVAELQLRFVTTVAQGDVQSVKRFIEEKASTLDEVTEKGNSVLHLAAAQGNKALVEYLSSFSGIRTRQNKQGQSALHFAAAKGQVDCTETLARFPDILKLQDQDGNTALHIALMEKQTEVARSLISQSAKTDLLLIPNHSGWTAPHLAVALGNAHAMIQIMTDHPSGVWKKESTRSCLFGNKLYAQGTTPENLARTLAEKYPNMRHVIDCLSQAEAFEGLDAKKIAAYKNEVNHVLDTSIFKRVIDRCDANVGRLVQLHNELVDESLSELAAVIAQKVNGIELSSTVDYEL